jgi:hypothetical protein
MKFVFAVVYDEHMIIMMNVAVIWTKHHVKICCMLLFVWWCFDQLLENGCWTWMLKPCCSFWNLMNMFRKTNVICVECYCLVAVWTSPWMPCYLSVGVWMIVLKMPCCFATLTCPEIHMICVWFTVFWCCIIESCHAVTWLLGVAWSCLLIMVCLCVWLMMNLVELVNAMLLNYKP